MTVQAMASAPLGSVSVPLATPAKIAFTQDARRTVRHTVAVSTTRASATQTTLDSTVL